MKKPVGLIVDKKARVEYPDPPSYLGHNFKRVQDAGPNTAAGVYTKYMAWNKFVCSKCGAADYYTWMMDKSVPAASGNERLGWKYFDEKNIDDFKSCTAMSMNEAIG